MPYVLLFKEFYASSWEDDGKNYFDDEDDDVPKGFTRKDLLESFLDKFLPELKVAVYRYETEEEDLNNPEYYDPKFYYC